MPSRPRSSSWRAGLAASAGRRCWAIGCTASPIGSLRGTRNLVSFTTRRYREPLVVTGDEARLHQVVSNLLANARKHTPPGSTVTVTGTPGGFTVHDDGPGFAPELVPHAFERFTRGDAARTRGGAGLGLSLVEAIVAAHGGSVGLASSPGDTTVTVRLPPTAA